METRAADAVRPVPLPPSYSMMQLCFRNDAASDNEDDESACHLGRHDNDTQWQRYRRPPKAIQVPAQLQLCFLGAAASQTAHEETNNNNNCFTKSSISLLPSDSGFSDSTAVTSERSRRPLEPELLQQSGCASTLSALGSSDLEAEDLDFVSRQALLKAQAELAMAQAMPMARMQLQVERTSRSICGPSPAGRGFGTDGLSGLSQESLRQLRESLLPRIQDLNEELVRCLIERDGLHMEQDAMLIEVEDLSRRAQDIASQLRNGGGAAIKGDAAESPKRVAAAEPSSPTRRHSQLASLVTSRLRASKLACLITGGDGCDRSQQSSHLTPCQ